MPKKAITTPKAKAIGPYSAAVESGDLVFVSGQIPLDSATGKLVEGDIAAQTRQSLENLKTILTAAGLTFAHVVKTTIFLTSMGDFAAVNEVYKSYVARALPRALDHCRRGAADGRQGRDRDDCLAQRRLNARSRTDADERPRVPGQAAAASVWGAGGAGRAGLHGGRGGGGRAGAARPRVGGEGADPRRRPRQGQVQGAGRRRQGRRAPRQVDRRGEDVRRADAGQDAGDDPDRARRPRRQAPVHRGRLRHRPRALSLGAGRPGHLAHLLHRLHRRRHGHREGGARHARQDRHAVDRSGLGLFRLPRPQDRRRPEARPATRSTSA